MNHNDYIDMVHERSSLGYKLLRGEKWTEEDKKRNEALKNAIQMYEEKRLKKGKIIK